MARTADSTVPYAVITSTAVSVCSLRTRRSNSRPDIPGIFRSVSTLPARQQHLKSGALRSRGFGRDRAAVLMNNLVNHREPQSGAILFGGEEGVEDPIHCLRLHSRTRSEERRVGKD